MLRSDNDATNLPQIRGTGEEHFRYFIENRLNYCDSKWYAGDYPEDNAVIRIYTPVDENGVPRTDLAVAANANITVTPYSNMYAGVRYKANGTLVQERLEANETFTFVAPNETFNDTETAIYGASQLSSLGDLAPLYLGYIDVGAATKLVELKIGDSTEGYQNNNLYHLAVGTNRLLKKIDIQNCIGFDQALVLTGCPNIEEIYAKGSGITGVELPKSGYLKVLQLPATISNLTLKNQLYIEDLTIEGYNTIKTITIENTPVDSLNILDKAINVERVRLTNVDWNLEDASLLYDFIERNIGGIDENGVNTDVMWIDGTCYIETLTGAEYNTIRKAFPYLIINYGTLSSQLTYMNHDGTETIITQTIQNGGDGEYTGEIPTLESTAQYDFTFSGWSLTADGDANENALKAVEGDRIVYAAYSKTVRNYTVSFYNGDELLESHITPYGATATYGGETPTNDSTGNIDDFEFIGWKPEPTNITGDTNCYAQYYDKREITDDWATIAENCLNGTATNLYKIGAYKPVEITYEDGTTETIPMEVVAHNHDELADGEPALEQSNISTSFTNRRPSIDVIVWNNDLYIIDNTSMLKWDGTSWEQVTTLTLSVCDRNCVLYNNEIHMISGTSHYKWNGTKESEVSTLPITFTGYCSLVVYNNEIHLFEQTSHYKWDGTEWTLVGDTPFVCCTSGEHKCSAIVYNDKIYVIGAGYNIYSHNSCYSWDGEEWVNLLTSDIMLSTAALAVYEDVMYMFAPKGDKSKYYKWVNTEWIEIGIDVNMKGTMSGEPVAFVYRGKLYVYTTEYNTSVAPNVNTTRISVLSNPKASLTFVAKNLLKDNRVFTSCDPYEDIGGWKNSDLRTWCNETFMNALPSDLQSVITETISFSDTGWTSKTIERVPDKISIPSYDEVNDVAYDRYIEGQGECYPVFTDNNSRQRTRVDSTEYLSWFTRSVQLHHMYPSINIVISNSGSTNAQARYKINGILIKFCI